MLKVLDKAELQWIFNSFLLHKQLGCNLGGTRQKISSILNNGTCPSSIPFLPHHPMAFPPLQMPSADTYTAKHFNVYRLPPDSLLLLTLTDPIKGGSYSISHEVRTLLFPWSPH